jgi:hypothetical protein
MTQTNLIDNFFLDENDYITFLVGLKERTLANDDGTCFAQLTKQGDCYLYKLSCLPNDKFIGDYVKPFRATKENVKQFNEGCKILADRLQIYMETNDINSIPETPLAFGDLTFIK